MGWFWGSSDGGSASDPAKQLDPSLRKFLEKESSSQSHDHQAATAATAAPPPPQPAAAPSQSSAPVAQFPRSAQSPPTAAAADATDKSSAAAGVPAESLYPDGRYAHLWKSYEPLAAIEARSKSDQEKLSDIVAAYNERRAGIGRAALENCAFQQLAVSDCFRTGSWASRLTMCRRETQALDRCYTMQSRFLKALGYLSVQGRGREAEEAVQMHADRLYRRMVEQEARVKEARERGEEVGSVLSVESVAGALRGDFGVAEKMVVGGQGLKKESGEVVVDDEKDVARKLDELRGVSPGMRQEFEERLKKLKGEDREIEFRAIQGEWAESKNIARQVEAVFEEERIKRLERRSQGKETVGDTIKRWWGW